MDIREEDEEFIKELRELYEKHKKVIGTDDYIFIVDIDDKEDIPLYINIIGE